MAFNTLTITDKGVALQAKVLGGATLTFTKAQSGSGALPGGTDITAMTALIAAEQDIVIASVTPSVPNKLTARIDFTNDGLETGYYWREIGLFADDPDDGEILYAYSNAGDEGTFMPAEGEGVTEQIVDLVTLISNVLSVTVTADNLLVHPVWADLLINGLIPCTSASTGPTIAISNANITEMVDGLKIVLTCPGASGSPPSSTNHAKININGMGAKDCYAPTGSGINIQMYGRDLAGTSVWLYREADDSFELLMSAGHVYSLISTKLNATSYTAADVLAKLLTVDVNESGINATTLQGNAPGAFAAASHGHMAGDVAGGTFAVARIPTLAISKTSGLQAALDGKAAAEVVLTGSANDIIAPGVYYIGTTVTDKPSTVLGTGGALIVAANPGSVVSQNYIPAIDTPRIYARRWASGSWQPWYQSAAMTLVT